MTTLNKCVILIWIVIIYYTYYALGVEILKLLAIDGNSIINRAFYGTKLLSTKEGIYTNAVYGFINILNRLCENENPDGVAIAFDLKAPTFRHKEYTEYKAGRKGMPPELASQLPIMKEWLTLAGYTCIECEGYEADDILGTLASYCEQSGNECVISTGDRDSLQLVSDSTRVLLATTKMGKPEIINYNKEALFEKYGLTPDEMIELKALMGDSSDNIPGVAGVGEKTATDLITRYHSIDYIYENLDSLEIKDGVRKKLADGKESAILSRWLGTICKTAPIDRDIEKYRTKTADTSALAQLMTKLEFFKLMEKMGLTPQNVQLSFDTDNTETKKITVLNAPCELSKTVDFYFENDEYAVVSGENVFRLDEATAKEILENETIKKRVYDYKNLYKKFRGIKTVCFDAMLAGYLCNPASSSYSAERLSQEYGATLPEISREADEIIKNACLFSDTCDKLTDELNKTKQYELLENIELP